MKKLKIDELKVQSFVTSFSVDENAEQFIGGATVSFCGPHCSADPNCSDNCDDTLNYCHYHTRACHAVTAPEDNCSVQYCYSVNASNCANGDNCYIDDSTNGQPL